MNHPGIPAVGDTLDTLLGQLDPFASSCTCDASYGAAFILTLCNNGPAQVVVSDQVDLSQFAAMEVRCRGTLVDCDVCQRFNVEEILTTECTTAVRPTAWGNVKARYR